MEKLQSISEFKGLQKRLITDRDLTKPTIVITAGTCGQASGANDLIRITKRELLTRGLTEKINLRITGCHGFCQMEPSILIEPQRTFYPTVSTKNMVRIIDAVTRNEVIKELLFVNSATGEKIAKQDDIPFYKKQHRTILAQSERMDPIRIYNYLENNGYSGLLRVLEKGDAKWVVDEVKASGLRGRGGAGFPTGIKWGLLAQQPKTRGKFIVCNADEGDPGAYMDRSVLEGNPHSIIEGMLIGAYGTGATEGVVYARNEYPLAIKHMIIALRQARELGLLGKHILGTDFSFDIKIVKGAGAFVCGEETALIASVEGKMGEPRQRPPFPIEKGIDGKPTAINNVETWANIPMIITQGASEFIKTGTKNNSGTKIFSLVGKVKYNGLVEVPMGTTINDIVYGCGGGPAGKAKIKAIQTGGPSGGCIPVNMFNLPVDYDSLKKVGAIMGSGGMIVMDENTCMVDVARYFMNFLKDESCGKCFTCRKGTQRMYEILDDISRGKGSVEQMDLLEELALVVKDTTMCALGQTAPNPILSTLRYFKDEYLKHITDKVCPAFICKELVGAPCQTACPLGTEAWRYIVHIARGEYEDAYRVIRESNPFPSVCARACSHPCEDRCRSGTSGGQAIAIRALKRFVTDRIDPNVYKPKKARDNNIKIAIIGAGPAGLTAAHYLSCSGYRVTLFEANTEPGGMLISGIPSYRLPREIVRKEINLLIDKNISVQYNTVLGRDFTLTELFEQGYKAICLALGAYKSQRLNISGEDSGGVYSASQFLKSFNLSGENISRGEVAIIGGGNSAIDSARVAIRQKNVSSVTVFYRRTLQEMPAFKEEISDAIKEGVKIATLVSPVEIQTDKNHLTVVKCIRNQLGEIDASGRHKPIPVEGSEFVISVDTLIVAIGEQPDTDCLISMGIKTGKNRTILVDKETLTTNRPGVFACGDSVSGPATIIEAIAAGKKASVVIDRYLRNEPLKQPAISKLPGVYLEPLAISEEQSKIPRAEPLTISIKARQRSFTEVCLSLSEKDAQREAKRCLRCDIEFTKPKETVDKKTA